MYRIILFLVLIALAAAGAAWVADQSGDVVLSWDGWRVATTLPVFALALGIAIVAAMLAWSLILALWRMPEKIRRSRRERRHARGRHAITHGLLAIGHGDSTAARGARRCRAQTCRARSAGAAAARAIGAARRQSRRRARRVPRHGGTRGHAAVGLARTVHRGAARRRSRRRGDDRRRGAETGAGLDLGLAGGAGISLRQGRLERGTGDPRQQS